MRSWVVDKFIKASRWSRANVSSGGDELWATGGG